MNIFNVYGNLYIFLPVNKRYIYSVSFNVSENTLSIHNKAKDKGIDYKFRFGVKDPEFDEKIKQRYPNYVYHMCELLFRHIDKKGKKDFLCDKIVHKTFGHFVHFQNLPGKNQSGPGYWKVDNENMVISSFTEGDIFITKFWNRDEFLKEFLSYKKFYNENY